MSDTTISVPGDRRVTVLRLVDGELSVWLDGKEFGMYPTAYGFRTDLRSIEQWLEQLVKTAVEYSEPYVPN